VPTFVLETVRPLSVRGRFAARWLCLYLEEHEQATLEDVELLVSNLRSLTTRKDHDSAFAILRKAARQG
jgi:hypothetical protein